MQFPLPHTKALAPGFARRVFFGWWIVLGTFLLGAMLSGFYFQGFSAYFLPLIDEFGVSRGVLSLALSIGSVVSTLSGPVQGVIVDRFGPRVTMMVAVVLAGAGLVLVGTAHSLTLLFLYLIALVALGANAVVFPASSAVSSWFIRKRSLALGLAMAGLGLGGLVVTFTNFLIEALGWRHAAMVMGGVLLVAGVPLTLLMRRSPEQYGLQPDGESPASRRAAKGAAVEDEINFTVREALATRAFWYLALAQMFRMFVAVAVGAHFIPAIVDKGLTSSEGAALFGLYGIVTLPSRLVFGHFGDQWPKRYLAASMYALMAASLVIYNLASGTPLLVAFAVLYGVAWGGGGGIIEISMRAEYFGRKHFATIQGLGALLSAFTVMAGLTFAGFSYDKTGSYQVAFYTFAGVAVLAVAAMYAAKRPYPKRPPP